MASTCISHLSLSFCAISRSQIEILTNFQCKIPIFKNFAPSQNSTRRQSLQYRTTVMQQESAISRIPGDACIFSLLHHSRHYAGILECQRMGYRIKMWDTSSISSLEYLDSRDTNNEHPRASCGDSYCCCILVLVFISYATYPTVVSR